MNTQLNYIDDYFTGQLNDDERRGFEEKCLSDLDFAKEVAIYISIRDGLKVSLQQQKKERFEKLYQQLSTGSKPTKIITLRRIAYLTAASVLLVIGWFTIFQRSTPKSIAANYMSENLNTLGLNMGVADSLQTGIAAYNSKSFAVAERLFKPLSSRPEVNPDALEDLGLTYMAQKQYQEALKSFDQLTAIPLRINRGLFYKALTLMARSEGTDVQQAKEILQQIVNKNLYGAQEARSWLKQIKN